MEKEKLDCYGFYEEADESCKKCSDLKQCLKQTKRNGMLMTGRRESYDIE